MNPIAILLLTALVSFGGYATQPDPYPNELGHLKFYRDYLAPLLPDRSDSKQVIQVLGPTQDRELSEWKISVLYSCNADATACLHGQIADRLYEIVVMPRHRVSLSHLMFSSSFVHTYASVSEINVTCDVYTDRFGLEYWVVSNDFPSYKKGDLLRVLYRAPHQITAPATVHFELPKS